MSRKRRKLLDRLKVQYKLVVLNKDTFEERISFTLSLLNVLIAVVSVSLFLIFITIAIIAGTPVKEYLPGYADASLKKKVEALLVKNDSLEQVFVFNDLYIQNINALVNDKSGIDISIEMPQIDQTGKKKLSEKTGPATAALYSFVEEEEGEEFTKRFARQKKINIEDFSFLAPQEGEVKEKYSAKNNITWQVVQGGSNQPVNAVYDGAVIYSGKDAESGYMLIVQHASNIISIYKGLRSLSKKTGDFVDAGEMIGVAGRAFDWDNAIQFELWYNGVSIDPNDYIPFNLK